MGIYMCMKSGCRVSGEDFAHSIYYKGVSLYSIFSFSDKSKREIAPCPRLFFYKYLSVRPCCAIIYYYFSTEKETL